MLPDAQCYLQRWNSYTDVLLSSEGRFHSLLVSAALYVTSWQLVVACVSVNLPLKLIPVKQLAVSHRLSTTRSSAETGIRQRMPRSVTGTCNQGGKNHPFRTSTCDLSCLSLYRLKSLFCLLFILQACPWVLRLVKSYLSLYSWHLGLRVGVCRVIQSLGVCVHWTGWRKDRRL